MVWFFLATTYNVLAEIADIAKFYTCAAEKEERYDANSKNIREATNRRNGFGKNGKKIRKAWRN